MVVDGVVQPDVVAAGGTVVHVDQKVDEASRSRSARPTVRWDDLDAQRKQVEIWMPTNASIELQSLRVAEAAMLDQVPVSRRRWTHYGSSISHCMDVDRPFDAWPVWVAHAATSSSPMWRWPASASSTRSWAGSSVIRRPM